VQLGNLTPAERLDRALAEGRKVHPQYAQHFETGFSAFWQRVPYSLGAWATYSSADRARHYPVLTAPDGPVFLAGEHLTYLTGWMAGALASARAVVEALHTRVQTARRAN
jgi:monoamine oxidase